MKKLTSFVLAILLFVCTFFSIMPNAFAVALKSASKPVENRVVIFGDGNFKGDSKQLSAGNYDIKDLGIGNDKLSSLKVPASFKVTLYENSGFSGKSKSFTNDVGWVGDDFNDLTSSIRIVPVMKDERIFKLDEPVINRQNW